MGQIIKTYLGIFMILFLMVTSIGILSAFVTIMNAQNLHSEIIHEIEDSDYAPSVISSCFDKAVSEGYEMNLVVPAKNGGEQVCTYGGMVEEDVSTREWIRVDLKFYFTISFFGIKQKHVLSGYAR